MTSSASLASPAARERGRDRRHRSLGGRSAASAADACDDHGFTQTHCVTGMAGRQPVLLPTGAGARDGDADQLAAERGVARDQQRLGLERHRVDDEPAAGAQRGDRGIEHARHRWRRRR